MIGVITYDFPHRKTYDLLCALKAKGLHDVCVICIPWEERKQYTPLYKHRPDSCFFHPEQLCVSFNYQIAMITNQAVTKCETYLIGGAGILGEPYSTNGRTVNSHPGYLPNVKGLDALKWAIYENQPIGVTTHIIDKETDAGSIIDRTIVPIYANDTFHAVAQRQYEIEISMLVDSVFDIDNGSSIQLDRQEKQYPVHKRMPRHFEMHLLSKFQRLVEKSSGVLP